MSEIEEPLLGENNPLLQEENYYEGYQKSIDSLKNNPEIVQFDKLCHLVFSTPDGQHLLEEIKKRYLIPALADPMASNYSNMVIYTEGFKNAFRTIMHCVLSHDQRIKAETKPS
jgi:hypothetical protein